ncbi:MAG: caspase family protein, partial [Methylococcales bacterium]|nr:caspase family protein [Methylococcales bacterium]
MTEQRYALLIGNNEFQENSGIAKLRCPPKDVQGLAAVLADSERGQFQVMPPLINKTRQEIEVGLFNILKKATKNDVVLIYFSGHGIPTNLKKQLYLSAKDTQVDALQVTAIAVSQIKELIDESNCNRIILILDCCFSGAIDKVFLKKGELSSQVNQTLAELSKDEGGGLHIMTASTANQTAVEKEGDRYSVFTKHLINGIATGDADKHTQGVIKLSELFAYVKEQVKTESTQTPQIFTLGGGDLLIAHSGKSPRNDRFSKIRTLLLDLLHHGQLDDKVYLEAINILNSPIEQLSELEKNRDSLLTELYTQKIGSVEFIGKWAVAGIVAKPDQPIKKPPPEIKKPEPVKPVEMFEKTVKATPKLANVQPEKGRGIKKRSFYDIGSATLSMVKNIFARKVRFFVIALLISIIVSYAITKIMQANEKSIPPSPEPIPVVTPKQVAKPTPEQQLEKAKAWLEGDDF